MVKILVKIVPWLPEVVPLRYVYVPKYSIIMVKDIVVMIIMFTKNMAAGQLN